MGFLILLELRKLIYDNANPKLSLHFFIFLILISVHGGGYMSNTKKLTCSGILIAIGVMSSHVIYIPVGVSKCFPIQHVINVLSAIFLGPLYALGNAFLISLLRNILGTGSLLAFPGSMFGAVLAGIFYRKFNKDIYAVIGEVVGTGIIGSLMAFPIASLLMGKKVGAFFFIIPFLLSTIGGSIIAYLIMKVISSRNLNKFY